MISCLEASLVGQDLNLQGLNEENTAAGSIASLEIPELTSDIAYRYEY